MKRCILVSTIAAVALVFAGDALATVTATFNAGTGALTVASDAADGVAFACTGGDVKVNGFDPTGGPFLCSDVVSIAITGGPGANAIDLSGATKTAFAALTTVTADGDDESDAYTLASLGNVAVDIGDAAGAADTIAIDGSAGADVITIASSVLIGTSSPTTAQVAGVETGAVDTGAGADAVIVEATPDVPAGTILGGADGDQIDVDDGGWTADGEDGGDFYDVDFGSLAGGVTVADTGGDAAFDSLSYSNCSAVVTGTTVAAGGETITYSGLESTPTCTSPPWVECVGAAQQCWSDFTVGGGAPTGLELVVFQAAGLIQIQVKKIPGSLYDVITGGPLSLTSLVGATINLGSVDPGIFIATGDITSLSYTLDATNGNTITFVMSPRASSWVNSGCTIVACGDDTTAADSDFAGILISAAGAPPAPPGLTPAQVAEFATFATASRGTWIATNAQSFSTPYWDPVTDAFRFELAAPHLKNGGVVVNTGFFRSFVTDAFLTGVFGIADPSTVSTGTFVVEKTSGGVTTTIPFAVTRVLSPDGILIEAGTGATVNGVTLTPFSYSTPGFVIKKAATTPSGGSGGSGDSSGGSSNEEPASAPAVPSSPPATPAAPAKPAGPLAPKAGIPLVTGDDDDEIVGGDGDFVVEAGNGNNYIVLGNGNNRVLSGGGDDRIFVGSGVSRIESGDGRDRIVVGAGSSVVLAGAGADVVRSSSGTDRVAGGAGDDVLLLGAGADRGYGGAGADYLAGGAGNDRLTGGPGIDRLVGGSGNDVLDLRDGRGGDRASCGAGRDVVFADRGDRIAADCEVVRFR